MKLKKLKYFLICFLTEFFFNYIIKYMGFFFFLQWMAFEEYANQPLIQKDGLSKYIRDLCLAKSEGDYQGFTPMTITSSVIDDHISSLYFLKDALHQD